MHPGHVYLVSFRHAQLKCLSFLAGIFFFSFAIHDKIHVVTLRQMKWDVSGCARKGDTACIRDRFCARSNRRKLTKISSRLAIFLGLKIETKHFANPKVFRRKKLQID